jgi:hypothetical protein
MTFTKMRTTFREDCGVWLAREPKWKRPRRYPFCMGVNRSGDRWTGYASIVRASHDIRLLNLWCRLRAS